MPVTLQRVGWGHIPPPRGARSRRGPQLLQRGRGEQHGFLISARGQAARPRSRRSSLARDLRRPRSRSGGGSATGKVSSGSASARRVGPTPTRAGAATCRSEGRPPARARSLAPSSLAPAVSWAPGPQEWPIGEVRGK